MRCALWLTCFIKYWLHLSLSWKEKKRTSQTNSHFIWFQGKPYSTNIFLLFPCRPLQGQTVGQNKRIRFSVCSLRYFCSVKWKKDTFPRLCSVLYTKKSLLHFPSGNNKCVLTAIISTAGHQRSAKNRCFPWWHGTADMSEAGSTPQNIRCLTGHHCCHCWSSPVSTESVQRYQWTSHKLLWLVDVFYRAADCNRLCVCVW